MLRLPNTFEDLLKSFVKETYYPSTRKKDFALREFQEGDYRFFVKGVSKLNKYFTSERSEAPQNYFNQKELRSGYLLYFLPVNALKVVALLRNLPKNFFTRPRKILDLGSGPGTGTIGTLLSAGSNWSGSFTLIDQNWGILKEGHGLLARMMAQGLCAKKNRFKKIRGNMTSPQLSRILPREKFDLIIMANVLNEFRNQDSKFRIIATLTQRFLTDTGQLLIMEPALRQVTRELMKLRDEIAERQLAYIQAPCLHQEACPMYADSPRDWCHMYWDWKRPEMIERFDRLVGIRKDYLKASYLLLNPQKPKHDPKQWRVVSGPLNSKGKTERLLCGMAGLPHLRRLMRLDRDQSKANQDFDRAMRGDIVTTGAEKKLRKKDSFKVVRL